MTALQMFKNALVQVADAAVTNVAPTGGFAQFLNDNPNVAVVMFGLAAQTHDYLAALEARQLGQSAVAIQSLNASSGLQAVPSTPPPPPPNASAIGQK